MTWTNIRKPGIIKYMNFPYDHTLFTLCAIIRDACDAGKYCLTLPIGNVNKNELTSIFSKYELVN